MVFLTLLTITSSLGAIIALLWPIVLEDIVVVNFGWGRELQPIADFPYECRKISGPGLQACEDMWLSESTRHLFLACSVPLSRKDWMPK
jgi:arylesterase / paraoxonase